MVVFFSGGSWLPIKKQPCHIVQSLTFVSTKIFEIFNRSRAKDSEHSPESLKGVKWNTSIINGRAEKHPFAFIGPKCPLQQGEQEIEVWSPPGGGT